MAYVTSPTIINNTISGNSASRGGGVYCYAGSPDILNNVINANSNGVYCLYGSPALVGNTITGNSGSGFSCGYGFNPTISNTIVWANGGSEITATYCYPTVDHSDVQGGYPGTGNINADPLFIDAGGGDFRLSCNSPAVSAGTNSPSGVPLPSFDQSGLDRRVIGSTIDIGADEVGVFWDLSGPPQAGGPPINFTATASSTHPVLNLAEVFISLGDGGTSGGIPVPLSSGRKLGLDLDAVLSFWLGLSSALRQASLNGCAGASTASFSLPSTTPVGITVYYAGITWDLGGGTVTSISSTSSAVTQ